MPTRAQLEDLLRQAEFEAETLGKYLQDTRDLVSDFEAAVKAQQAKVALYRGMLAKSGTNEVLHIGKHLATVNSMTNDHALAISKTQRGKDKKFRAAMHAAGFTQNSLADAIKVSSASLTRYRDKRPVPKAIADKVKDLTGFDGTWPGGVVE